MVFDVTLDTLVEDIRSDWPSSGSSSTPGSPSAACSSRAPSTAPSKGCRSRDCCSNPTAPCGFDRRSFGDEKDRVVRRANGNYTYFASDIAYCLNKKERGFDRLIYIWGADHHGYVTRTRAAFEALGNDPDEFTVLLVQFAVLYRGTEKVSMSTRSGEFVTLRELRREVGDDAARFFYALRKPEKHMDFDLELAKSKSNENPVYYVQYAHARVCSVFRQMREKNIAFDGEGADLSLLVEEREQDLMRDLSRFPEVVEAAARALRAAPGRLLPARTRPGVPTTYYNAHPFLASEQPLRDARLVLVDAARQVFANGLDLLGVSAPESMWAWDRRAARQRAGSGDRRRTASGCSSPAPWWARSRRRSSWDFAATTPSPSDAASST
ncbi:MAG: arginine--tRNA ligase [Gammaproteobacteria bacterium]|nr:arginine--tRNA ligase [Gammaproteobacteria bacterium]